MGSWHGPHPQLLAASGNNGAIPFPRQQRRRRIGGPANAPAPSLYERFARYNRVMDSLTNEQRELIAELLRGEKVAGMEEVLAYLSDNHCQLMMDGEQLPFEPFETSYAYDLAARLDGQGWPDEQRR